MSKKITKEIFLERFKHSFPECEIEILDYTAISNPVKVRCCKCGKEHLNKKASNLLKNYKCCIEYNKTKYDRLLEIYQQMTDYHLIKKIDKDNVLVHCDKCGNNIERNIQACLASPKACKYCETTKKMNMLTIEEAQNQINEIFYGEIEILTYNGQLEKNVYKCLKCGLIFKNSQICLLSSRGCPKCDRFKSKGEKFIANLLKQNNIIFKEQASVKKLPLQKFDFEVYNDNGQVNYYIEVQGEQHYKQNNFFKTPLEVVQERDERKRAYCKDNGIPLYELIYKKGKFLNLDILPIKFNDYPC